MTVAFFTKDLFGRLVPAGDVDKAAIARIKPGELVTVEVKKPRNGPFLQLFWVLCQWLYENCPEDSKGDYESSEDVSDWLKIRTGHRHRREVTLDGERIVFYRPKSISFAKMNDADFKLFFDRCCDIITTEVIDGLPASDLKREIEDLIK